MLAKAAYGLATILFLVAAIRYFASRHDVVGGIICAAAAVLSVVAGSRMAKLQTRQG